MKKRQVPANAVAIYQDDYYGEGLWVVEWGTANRDKLPFNTLEGALGMAKRRSEKSWPSEDAGSEPSP